MRLCQIICLFMIVMYICTLEGVVKGDINNYYATNASGPLDIPSYIPYNGVNEVVHPDVVYFPQGWNGYQYWMAYTPFPNNDATYENPCLAVSNDNVTWIVPPGLTNPIDSYSSNANDYYSDTELVMSPDQQTMYCLWRRFKNGQFEKLYVKSTTDGINWGTLTETLNVNVNQETLISPAVIYDGSQYMLWTVDKVLSPRVVRLRTSSSIFGPWSSPIATDIVPLTYTTQGAPYSETWHINVCMIDSEYWMINNDTLMGGSNGLNLYLGNSTDGIHWTFANHPILYQRNNYLFWDQKLYRASMIPVDDGQQIGFRIWYSVMRKATDTNPPWRIGYTEAWCAPRNTRLTNTSQESVTIVWDGFATAYQKTTSYKVQHTGTPFVESSWEDETSWSGNLSYIFLRNAYPKHFYRVIAKVE
jgi:hypothetical protein